MADDFLYNSTGKFLDEAWQAIYAPGTNKQAFGNLLITPINLNLQVYANVRINYGASLYRYVARNRAIVTGGTYFEFFKITDGMTIEARLKETPQTASITAITKANPGVVTVDAMPGQAHDGAIIDISGVGGMTQVDGRYIMNNISGNTFELQDQDGVNVNTTSFGTYTSGGTVEIALADAVFDYYEETIPQA